MRLSLPHHDIRSLYMISLYEETTLSNNIAEMNFNMLNVHRAPPIKLYSWSTTLIYAEVRDGHHLSSVAVQSCSQGCTDLLICQLASVTSLTLECLYKIFASSGLLQLCSVTCRLCKAGELVRHQRPRHVHRPPH